MNNTKCSVHTLRRIAEAFQAGAITRQDAADRTGLSTPCVSAGCVLLVERGCLAVTGKEFYAIRGTRVRRTTYQFLRLPEVADRDDKPAGPFLLAVHWRGVEVRA